MYFLNGLGGGSHVLSFKRGMNFKSHRSIWMTVSARLYVGVL
jgi:hypothetical protein